MTSVQQQIPSTQKALQWVRVSGTNPFEWTTSAPVIEPSELDANQVLIENHAVSLNPIDYKIAESNFLNVNLPSVTGYDVSGRIVAIGNDVQDYKVGDEVFGTLSFKPEKGGGAFQQYSVGNTDTLVKKPSNLSHEDAATLGVAYLSALEGLRQVNIDSTTSVFIPGGSGGVGHFSIQIARIRGAKQIITSASKDDGIQILKEQYKINDVINHSKENVVDRVLELTQGQGVNIVYDSTYLPSSFEKSTQVVRENGSWIVLGDFGKEGSPEAINVAQRKANLVHAELGRYWFGPEQKQLKSFFYDGLTQAAKWIQEGKLKPYINKIIKLEETENALNQLKQGKGGFGKIVIKLV
ncbi:unnamed protein product [Adineta ricciae]|uniref:Enoyl reductase (ER) domain-containing protein n=1 Tax=Adineta ricciae TaxID=249248 RepID=A0A815EDU9_ADIRI|nr:unnamed protein product [Adineta ricciae]CAF1410133.1 unnamed protein product [Adineta ricciae]